MILNLLFDNLRMIVFDLIAYSTILVLISKFFEKIKKNGTSKFTIFLKYLMFAIIVIMFFIEFFIKKTYYENLFFVLQLILIVVFLIVLLFEKKR